LQRGIGNAVRGLPEAFASRGFPITSNDRRLAALENRYRGKRCFILGNGPSLKQHDLSLLRDEHVFVTNWFVMHDEFARLRHCYYCVSDPHFWNFGEGLHEEMVAPVAAKADVLSFFEQGAREPAKLTRLREHLDRTFFIRLKTARTANEGFVSTNVAAHTNLGFTVIIDLCLPIAHYLGFSEIYLMGCDCDYKLNGTNDLSQSFFYDISRIPAKDLEHVLKYRAEMEQLEKWLAGYRVVRKVFEANDRKVYNAGYGGKLEVFDRVDYGSLFPKVAAK
jgi:hypothetical protein